MEEIYEMMKKYANERIMNMLIMKANNDINKVDISLKNIVKNEKHENIMKKVKSKEEWKWRKMNMRVLCIWKWRKKYRYDNENITIDIW